MTLFLYLICGVLPGVSDKAYVKIFPAIDRVVVMESGSEVFTALNLKGQRIADLQIEGRPANVCEVDGYLFFSYGSKDGAVNLLRTDANFSRKRTVKNSAFFYPNVINGKLYGLDIFKLAQQSSDFPRIAWRFDAKQMKFTGETFLKLPEELSEYQMQEKYWLLSRANTTIAVFANSRYLYILSPDYQKAEAIESENVPSKFTKIALEVPGGFKNYGQYSPKKVLLAEEAKREYLAWITGQTQIFHAWQVGEEIFIGYGISSEGNVHVARLNASYTLDQVGTYPGFISGAAMRKMWMILRDKNSVSIQAYDLP